MNVHANQPNAQATTAKPVTRNSPSGPIKPTTPATKTMPKDTFVSGSYQLVRVKPEVGRGVLANDVPQVAYRDNTNMAILTQGTSTYVAYGCDLNLKGLHKGDTVALESGTYAVQEAKPRRHGFAFDYNSDMGFLGLPDHVSRKNTCTTKDTAETLAYLNHYGPDDFQKFYYVSEGDQTVKAARFAVRAYEKGPRSQSLQDYVRTQAFTATGDPVDISVSVVALKAKGAGFEAIAATLEQQRITNGLDERFDPAVLKNIYDQTVAKMGGDPEKAGLEARLKLMEAASAQANGSASAPVRSGASRDALRDAGSLAQQLMGGPNPRTSIFQ